MGDTKETSWIQRFGFISICGNKKRMHLIIVRENNYHGK